MGAGFFGTGVPFGQLIISGHTGFACRPWALWDPKRLHGMTLNPGVILPKWVNGLRISRVSKVMFTTQICRRPRGIMIICLL